MNERFFLLDVCFLNVGDNIVFNDSIVLILKFRNNEDFICLGNKKNIFKDLLVER